MIPLPPMKEHQFAVLQAEITTGIVLQVNGNRFTGQGQLYSIHDDFATAKAFASRTILEKPETECVIYDCHEKALLYVSSREIRDLRKEEQ
jgi:hypothetical protein